jgi:hypothetical protein
VGVGIGARFHDPKDLGPEPSDCRACRFCRLHVLDDVMQERRDRLVLVRSELEGDCTRPEQMTYIRDRRAFADLRAMQLRGHDQGAIKATREDLRRGQVSHSNPSKSSC